MAAVVGIVLAGSIAHPWEVRAKEQVSADTTLIFESWAEWRDAYEEFVAALDAFEALAEEPIGSASELLSLMEARDRVYRTVRAVEGYLYLRLQLDATDEEARSRQHLLDETDRRWYRKGSPLLTRTLSDLGLSKIQEWMADDEALSLYEFFFRRFFESAGQPAREGQEELRAFQDILEKQTDRVYRALTVAEGPSVEVRLESGELLEMNVARSRMIYEELTSALDRRRVSRAWLEKLGGRSQTYAALLEGIVERLRLLAEVRGFDSALSAQLHADIRARGGDPRGPRVLRAVD
jgi:oligoendopeptidase F